MKRYFPSQFDIPCSMFCGSKGFTLIEIMLVVVIILIATAVATPVFRGTFKSTQMTDATRSTVRMARFARSLSILRQSECVLHFEEDRLVLTCAAPAEPKTERQLPQDIQIGSFENLSEEHSPDNARKVHYYPNGMNDGFELALEDDQDHRRIIKCQPYSGKVTVEE